MMRKQLLLLGLITGMMLFVLPAIPALAMSLPYSEDFDDGTADGWSAVSGSWTIIADGTNVYRSLPADSLSRSVVGENAWDDYEAEARVKVDGWGSAVYRTAGLITRYTDTDNYYLFVYELPGELMIKKKVSGTMTTLASKSFALNTNTWYTFRAEVEGSNLTFFVNGTEELSVSDGSLGAGKAGLISVFADGRYDDFSVAAVGGGSGGGPGTVINEDFSAGASDFIPIAGGNWAVNSGRYVLSSPADATPHGNISVHKTALSGDFTLTTLLRVTGTASVWDDASVLFHYTDADNYYFASFNESNDGATNGIFKLEGGVLTELADFSSTIAPDTDYEVEIVRSGSDTTVRLDGNVLAAVSDGTFGGGLIGYGSRNDGAEFDNLLVDGTVLTDTTAPTAPTNLSATAVSSSVIDLSWTASTDNVGVIGYKVYRDGAEIDSTSNTLYSDTGLAASTTYSYTVKAYDASDNLSGSSNTANATTLQGGGGGQKPGPGNTGPTNPNILTPTGGMTVTTDGTVIENVEMTGTLTIKANNVIVRNFRIIGGTWDSIKIESGYTGTLIEDGEIDGQGATDNGVSGADYTARRLHIHNMGGDGFKANSNVILEGNYVHDIGHDPGAHGDAVQIMSGSNITIVGNNFDVPIISGQGHNSAIIIKPDFGTIDNVLVDGNWMNGGNNTVYSRSSDFGTPTNITFSNNWFGRDYRYGVKSFNGSPAWSNNRWEDNGQLIP